MTALLPLICETTPTFPPTNDPILTPVDPCMWAWSSLSVSASLPFLTLSFVSCPSLEGQSVSSCKRIELGPEDVSLLERCPHFRGWYVPASVELGPEDVSLLERCPHFRGWYVQASMELGPKDVSLLERCPHFRGRENVHHLLVWEVCSV